MHALSRLDDRSSRTSTWVRSNFWRHGPPAWRWD